VKPYGLLDLPPMTPREGCVHWTVNGVCVRCGRLSREYFAHSDMRFLNWLMAERTRLVRKVNRLLRKRARA
jgi:hypothetical protein